MVRAKQQIILVTYPVILHVKCWTIQIAQMPLKITQIIKTLSVVLTTVISTIIAAVMDQIKESHR